MAGDDIGYRLAGVFIWHVGCVEAEALLGEFHRYMLKRAGAYRGVVKRWVGLFGVGDELWHGLGRQVRVHHQDQGRFYVEANRSEIVLLAVVHLLVEPLIYRQRGAREN